ncbi:hypothetical protein ACFZBM_30230 [Streptomyces lavendulae]|uniref:hypothetical protein n=1 Tax=Streptomyces lavendulae TaxID=1914 RepID=UPI00131AB8F7|nr:hypothetical protein [Streptomyces lavendulae]
MSRLPVKTIKAHHALITRRLASPAPGGIRAEGAGAVHHRAVWDARGAGVTSSG